MSVVVSIHRTNCVLHGHDPQMTASVPQMTQSLSVTENLLLSFMSTSQNHHSVDEDFNRWAFASLMVLAVADNKFPHSFLTVTCIKALG